LPNKNSRLLYQPMEIMERSWTVLTCQCSPIEGETCSWIFFENGANGLEIDNLNDEAILVKASFSQSTLNGKNEGVDIIRSQFEQFGLVQVAKTLKAENLADQDWLSNWKKHFEPFDIGEVFMICPPWRDKKDIGERKKIIIDPGMAFGTGQHITTKYCLEAIEKWAKGQQILDVGTGSGILSIACAILLPKASILALDTDNQALINAQHNIELNHFQDRIKLLDKSPSDAFLSVNDEADQFDTVLSNITAEDIISLMPTYNNLVKVNGVLILAGIIEERLTQLDACLSQYQFKTLEKIVDRGWAGITLTRLNQKN